MCVCVSVCASRACAPRAGKRPLRKSRVNKRGNQTDKRGAPTASLIRLHLGGLNVLNGAYVG